MAVENVCCPHCGKEALATIPLGQRLVRVIKSRFGKGYTDTNLQHCKCQHCNNPLNMLPAIDTLKRIPKDITKEEILNSKDEAI